MSIGSTRGNEKSNMRNNYNQADFTKLKNKTVKLQEYKNEDHNSHSLLYNVVEIICILK